MYEFAKAIHSSTVSRVVLIPRGGCAQRKRSKLPSLALSLPAPEDKVAVRGPPIVPPQNVLAQPGTGPS